MKKESMAQAFSCEFCDISKNTFFHRTPLVAASEEKRYFGNFASFIQISTGVFVFFALPDPDGIKSFKMVSKQ